MWEQATKNGNLLKTKTVKVEYMVANAILSFNFILVCILTLQLEKQQKLNELTVVATLKLHQIQLVTGDSLSHDLNPALVFESSDLDRLQQRIKELENEKLLQKKQMR